MKKFRNVSNNYVETVDISDSLRVLFLGPLVLFNRGLNGHGCFWLIAMVGTYFMSPIFAKITFSILMGGFLNLLYAVSIQRLLAEYFLRAGWVLVGEK